MPNADKSIVLQKARESVRKKVNVFFPDPIFELKLQLQRRGHNKLDP